MSGRRIYTVAEAKKRKAERHRKWAAANPDKVKAGHRKQAAKRRVARITKRQEFYLDNPTADRRKVER